MVLCRHQTLTTPRRDERGEYRRCLDCGTRLAWSWGDDFPILPPRPAQALAEFPMRQAARLVWDASRKSA